MNFLRSEPGAEPLLVEGIFKAPVERVFRAWTDPKEVVKWFGRPPHVLVAAEIDLRPGGRYRFAFQPTEESAAAFEGEYLAVEPNVRLAFSWSHVRDFADGRREATPRSEVSIEFEPMGAATRLRLRHEGIVRHEARQSVGEGWQSSFTRLQNVFVQTKRKLT